MNIAEREGGNLYFGKEFEPCEIAVLRKLLTPGDTVFDVGANVGIYTLLASRLIGASGSVHAFEPVSSVYHLLVSNIALNQAANVVPNRLAMSDKGGQLPVFINQESGLSAVSLTRRGKVVGIEAVPSTTLDAYAESHGVLAVNFLKIDVEGHEGEVLRGGSHLAAVARDLVILCELDEKNISSLGRSVDEVIHWMSGVGYEAWSVNRRDRCLLGIPGKDLPPDPYVVFVRPGSARYRDIMDLTTPGRLA